MENKHPMQVIARIRNDLPQKFGVPRQSGLVEALEAQIVFEPAFRNADAVRGLEDFSHIWLIWEFSQAVREDWSPTVRPPRLGGNARMGVFATRSPFRPNPIGLSVVRLIEIHHNPDLGPLLKVTGADLMDGTPIFDIKPYLPYADCLPEATGGFTDRLEDRTLAVDFPDPLQSIVPADKREALLGLLSQDPRPSYQNDPGRVYGLSYGGLEIKFTVKDKRLSVCGVEPSKRRSGRKKG